MMTTITKVIIPPATPTPKSSAALDFGVGVAGGMITLVMVVIISFYMLLDGRRIYQYLCRVLPGDEEVLEAYLFGLQRSFTRYVKGQFLLALVVGLGAGLGVWILGWQIIGVWPEGSRYVLLFGVWAGLTEVIPLLGPWLGAAPPFVMALFYSPAAALGVLIVYVVVQQLENHILVPNIMGTTVGVHPLGVIFALLVGAQVGGILGMLAALPVLSMLKHTMDFFEIEFSRAPWFADDGVDGDVAGRLRMLFMRCCVSLQFCWFGLFGVGALELLFAVRGDGGYPGGLFWLG